MRILMTAFDPFGGDTVNSAEAAIRSLPDTLGGIAIEKLTVPTVFGKSVATVVEALGRVPPCAVICVGQVGGHNAVTPERVAINLDDADVADNEGNMPLDAPIRPDGPAAYFSTLPVKAVAREIQALGLPARVSYSAGTFVCNHLMYGVLHHIHIHGLLTRAGLIHIPFLPRQAERGPSMSADDAARALSAAIRVVAAETKHGIAGGLLCRKI